MYHSPSHPSCCFCQCILDHLPTANAPQDPFLCQDCSEEGKSIITLARDVGEGTNRPFVDVEIWMIRMQGRESDASKKISDANKKIIFMLESLSAFKNQTQSDVELKPGCNGPSKPAHRALLAAKSEIFKNMLNTDDFKAQSATVTLVELNADELDSLIEFLYLGFLPEEKLKKHACALFAAAHKYEIWYLQEVSASHLQGSLSKANALDILEIADTCSYTLLKDASLSYILQNMNYVVFSDKYQSFALKNPLLCTEVTRAFLSQIPPRPRKVPVPGPRPVPVSGPRPVQCQFLRRSQ